MVKIMVKNNLRHSQDHDGNLFGSLASILEHAQATACADDLGQMAALLDGHLQTVLRLVTCNCLPGQRYSCL